MAVFFSRIAFSIFAAERSKDRVASLKGDTNCNKESTKPESCFMIPPEDEFCSDSAVDGSIRFSGV